MAYACNVQNVSRHFKKQLAKPIAYAGLKQRPQQIEHTPEDANTPKKRSVARPSLRRLAAPTFQSEVQHKIPVLPRNSAGKKQKAFSCAGKSMLKPNPSNNPVANQTIGKQKILSPASKATDRRSVLLVSIALLPMLRNFCSSSRIPINAANRCGMRSSPIKDKGDFYFFPPWIQ